MQVHSIQQNINFEAKKRRFIDLESQEQLTQILRKMDNETEYKENEYSFAHTKTTRLELINHDKGEKIAELVDARQNLKKLPEGKDMFGTTSLTIGKVQLAIDNKSGEILAWNKPFLSTWRGIMKKINYVLIMINASYHQAGHVRKHQFGLEGLTKKGAEALEKIKVKIGKK